MPKIQIIFQRQDGPDGKPSPDLTFVEVHDEAGNSINAGEWIADGDYEALEIDLEELAKQVPR